MKELMIKKDKFTCDAWTVIKEKRYTQKKMKKFFEGYLGLLKIDKVSEPQFWNYNNNKVKVCDSRMKWIRILPKDENYTIMGVFDEDNKLVVSYIDIIDGYGKDEDGIIFVNDLFLDIIVYPDGQIIIDDMDELKGALEQNIITQEKYEKAIETSKNLQNEILLDKEKFNNFCKQCLKCMLAQQNDL
ncbi:MAG: DUF402 domain-containing protein [Clostridiaceae bacterium]|nr:DUF402 domain-containing protein [Clostridiaceae bacterium]